METLKKQVHQIKKEASEASSQWEEKYASNIGKQKKGKRRNEDSTMSGKDQVSGVEH